MSNALALRDNFQSVLNEVACYFQQLGVDVKAFDDNDDLSAVPADVLAPALEQMESFAATLREIPVNEYNDKELLRKHLKRLDWDVPDESIYDLIEENDTIEIYTQDAVQVFRNKRFLEVCSYSLNQVMTTPSFELYYRDPEIVQRGYREYFDLIENPSKGIVESKTPRHILWEVKKIPSRALSMNTKFLTVLFKEDAIAGVLHTTSTTPVESFAVTPFFSKFPSKSDVLSKLTPEEIRKFEREE